MFHALPLFRYAGKLPYGHHAATPLFVITVTAAPPNNTCLQYASVDALRHIAVTLLLATPLR